MMMCCVVVILGVICFGLSFLGLGSVVMFVVEWMGFLSIGFGEKLSLMLRVGSGFMMFVKVMVVLKLKCWKGSSVILVVSLGLCDSLRKEYFFLRVWYLGRMCFVWCMI